MTDPIDALFRVAMRLDADFPLEDRLGFDDVPGWDSVGHMSLVHAIESRFGIVLDMDEILDLDTVGAVRALIARKTA